MSEQHLRINFTCPHCKTKYTASREQAGKKGKCKNCDGQMRVPELTPNKTEDEIPAKIVGLTKTPWYNKNIWIVFWLVIFFPLGIYALAKNTVFSNKHKIGFGIAFVP